MNMNITDNKNPMYDKETLEKELQDVRQNLKNILDRIKNRIKTRSNSSTTNIDEIHDMPNTFEEMDWKTIWGLINEIYQLTAELNQITLEAKNDSQ